MIDLCMVWRREDPKQPALEAIREAALHYKKKKGRLPNFVNVPPGFLKADEAAQLQQRWTVAQNAPAYFVDDIWLGEKTPASDGGGLDTAQEQRLCLDHFNHRVLTTEGSKS